MNFAVYLLAAILWGMYAIKQQVHVSTDRFKLYLCFLLNSLFWPIAMIIAIIRFEENTARLKKSLGLVEE